MRTFLIFNYTNVACAIGANVNKIMELFQVRARS
jgi:hypothetical protein